MALCKVKAFIDKIAVSKKLVAVIFINTLNDNMTKPVAVGRSFF